MDDAFHTAWRIIKARREREKGIDGLEFDEIVPDEEKDDQTWDDWSWDELHKPSEYDEHGDEIDDEEEDEEEQYEASMDSIGRHMLASGMSPADIAAHNLKIESMLPQKPSAEGPEATPEPEKRSISNAELARLLGLD